MQLQKQDIGVWVKTNDETPKKEGMYLCKTYDGKTFFQIFVYQKSFGIEGIEWLKPLTGVYVLTEAELNEIIGVGVGSVSYSYSEGLSESDTKSVDTFLQSITKQ